MEDFYREQIESAQRENRLLQEQIEKEEKRQLRGGRQLLNKIREARLPVEISDALSKVYTEYNKLQGNLYDAHSLINVQQEIAKEIGVLHLFENATEDNSTDGWCSKTKQNFQNQMSKIIPVETKYVALSVLGALSYCSNKNLFVALAVGSVAYAALKYHFSNNKNSIRARTDKELELAKNVLQHLDLDRISPLAEASEELDKVLRKRFGFSLYSREFPELCKIVPNVTVSSAGFSGVAVSEDLKMFVTSLESYYQKNIIQVCSDIVLKSEFVELTKILSNSEFIKVNALYQACKIIKLFPDIFPWKDDEFSLNCVRQAYCIINLLSAESSDMDQIRESIGCLRRDFDRMKEMHQDSISEMQ